MNSRTRTLLAATLAATVGSALAVVTGPGFADDVNHEAKPTFAVSSMMRDLQPTTADPLDGARSRLEMDVHRRSTTFRLRLGGIEPTAAGRSFGAHLHLGPCVAGNGAAALAHYNTDVLAGAPSPVADPTTEVWLDFTVTGRGTARAEASVPFAVLPGDRAVVVHQEPTAPGGAAGPRLACAPVVW